MFAAIFRTFFEYLSPENKKIVCGWIAPGHHYTLELIRLEDDSYVLDPFTTCRHCDSPLPQSQYNKVVARLEAERAEREEESDLW